MNVEINQVFNVARPFMTCDEVVTILEDGWYYSSDGYSTRPLVHESGVPAPGVTKMTPTNTIGTFLSIDYSDEIFLFTGTDDGKILIYGPDGAETLGRETGYRTLNPERLTITDDGGVVHDVSYILNYLKEPRVK